MSAPLLVGCILAGGRATRLGGRAKPLVVLDGASILERQLDVLAPRVGDILVAIAPGSPALPVPARHAARVRFVEDTAPAAGPLAGIAACISLAPPWLLVVAGDLPNLRGEVLDLLIAGISEEVDAVAFRVRGLPEPLLAVYGEAAVAAAARRIAAGRRKAAGLLLDEGLRVCWIEEAALRAVDPELRSLDDVDTLMICFVGEVTDVTGAIRYNSRLRMRVGPVEIETPVLLAPMAAVTDLPFRTVCEEHGVGFTITEFLSAHALKAKDPRTHAKMTASLNGRAFGVQIFGREEDAMQEAARMAVSIGASLVDINMGCPAKRVVAGECGSALMREPEIAQTLVRAVVAAVPANVPVTVKHRAGWDQAHRNAPEFACAMVEAGAQMITVHGRTRTQGFSGESDRAIIGKVREALPAHVPLVGNGDVIDVEGYVRMREETGCDAVMIGRGALGNPWLFARLREITAGRPDPGQPSIEERRAIFRRHVGLIREMRSGPKVLNEVRKACAWYAKGLHGCNALRLRVWDAQDIDAAVAQVEAYFAEMLTWSVAA